MLRCLLGLLLFLSGMMVKSQTISLDFEAKGAAIHLDEVEVVNMRDGRKVSVFSGENLELSASGVDSQIELSDDISVTPDVAAGGCDILFSTSRPGYVFLRITDAMGRMVVDEDRELTRGQHHIRVASLKSGAHKVHLMTSQAEHTHWIMSGSKPASGEVEVEWRTTYVANIRQGKMPVTLPYVAGDRLLLKGMAGQMVHFRTLVPTRDSVLVFHFVPCVDGDGHHYATVEIGGRLWMAENLRTTRLRTGSILPQVEGNTSWRDAALPAYCWYQNNIHHQYQYGALYNWYAVSDEGLCPAGWLMPTDQDWLELEKVIDSSIDVTSATGWRGKNGALKMRTQQGWDSQKGNNHYGFSALPAGRRSNEGHFNSLGDYAYWWTATTTEEVSAWSRYILPDYDYLYRGSFSKNYGFSVRCILEGD